MSISLEVKRAALAALEIGGEVTPERVVAAARDPNHPLHNDGFVWDANEAVQTLALVRARAIIREVRVSVTYEDRTLSVPVYVSSPDKAPGTQGYVNVAVLATDKDRALLALEREIASIEAAVQRALGIAIAVDLAVEFQGMLSHTERLREKAGLPARKVKRAPIQPGEGAPASV